MIIKELVVKGSFFWGQTAAYAALKMMGIIGWSWWAVFAPVLIWLALIAIGLTWGLCELASNIFSQQTSKAKEKT